MINKTLNECVRACGWSAGVKVNTASSGVNRHETGDLHLEVNSAYRELREETVARDFPFYLQETALAVLPTSRAATGENYSLIDWPEEHELITRIDVLVSSRWRKLDPIAFENIRDVIPQRSTVTSAIPTHYAELRFGGVSGSTTVDGEIAIAPFCSSGQYKYTYLERWDDTTAGTDVLIFPSESAFRWLVWNVVARIASRDRNQAARFQMAQRERERIERAMGRFLGRQGERGGGTMRRPVGGRWSAR